MTSEQLLAFVRQIDLLAKNVVDAMQSGETPSMEDLGIAFVSADEIRDMCEAVERDVLSELMGKAAA